MNQLPPVPETLIDTRLALHRLAAYVIAPERHRVTERFGLSATEGGFGTPPFDGRRIRVQGLDLIDENDDESRSTTISSLSSAAEFLNGAVDEETAAEHDTPKAGDLDADLNIDAGASQWLGQWFGMAFEALARVRADEASIDASEPQLWPGHFDPAIEAGDENHRASYGASPGDDGITEPYLYLSIWWPDRLNLDADDTLWNAPSFTGAVLRASEFPADKDPVEVATDFWRNARDHLAQG